MKLELPLKTDIKIWQYFGNPNPVYNGLGIKGHNGIDFKAEHGTPIYASHDGMAFYEFDEHSGHGVTVTSNETILYKGQQVNYKTIYWHMVDSAKEPQYTSPIEAKPMQVKTGDLIGYADNTGLSTGDHLHYGMKFMVNGQNIEMDNGFKGATDPFPFLPVLKYRFTSPMELGDHSDDVNHLQHYLYQHGYMDLVPYDQQGIYGNKTAKAVLRFQIDKIPSLSFYEKYILAGTRVGNKTLAVINQG